MTLQELLEHAHLDALGQLDEREQAAFEAAFAVAPPAVKAQVRHEQARWAPMEHLLPQIEPSPELRGRVLEAVSAAMLSQESDMTLRTSKRVSAAWRTTSIGLLTAVVVLVSAFAYVYQTSIESSKTALRDETTEYMLHAFKGDLRSAVMSPGTQRAFFKAAENSNSSGAVWTNPDWSKAFVFVDLPRSADGQEYRIVVLGADGKVQKPLDSFISNGVLQTRELPSQAEGTRLAVVTAERGSAPTAFASMLLTVTI